MSRATAREAFERSADRTIVLYDGQCVLCETAVGWVVRRDRGRSVLFIGQEDPRAPEIARLAGVDPARFGTSVFVIERGQPLYESDAAIAVLARLRGWRGLARLFALLPRFVRDPIYRWVARHRYRLFGRRDSCFIPDAESRNAFL